MITAQDRELRRQSIGSSDAAAIVGCDPWRNAADVYYSKIGESADKPSEAMEVGNRLEGLLLDLAKERFGGGITRDIRLEDSEYPALSANLDGLHWSLTGIECKYVGPKGADYWGDPETDQVPDHVALQCQHQMRVACLDSVLIPAAIVRPFVGLRFEFFHVKRDDDLIDSLVTAELAFWKHHVVPRIPPMHISPCLETLKRLRREPASVVDLDEGHQDTQVAIWLDRVREAKEAEKIKDDAYAAVLSLLGDAECGRLPDGRTIWYREENAGKKVDWQGFADACNRGDLLPKFTTQTTRKILRIKKWPK